MPGIFPAVRLADHMCVDGGVKEVVPVQIAVRDLGCNEVVAIRVSARPDQQPTDPSRSFATVIARGVLDITYDALADDDVEPFGGWGEGVQVRVIRPSLISMILWLSSQA
jgi:predicted acylesterase/phospholipase RssA